MTAPMAGNKNYDFGTDVLVDILMRLPPSSRRRARLVCRHWRGAVDSRTTEMQLRHVTTLVSAVEKTRTGKTTASGYVVDDDSSGWRGVKLWTSDEDVHVVGTCNGLICFCNDEKLGGRVSLLNPITEEQLVVPPLPLSGSGQGQPAPSVRRWHEEYSFGYHPVTGRYKIVHVDLASEPIAVQVFTLLKPESLYRCNHRSPSLQ
ncbi:hypothetical protein QYE76_056426 [Lolium multiflorum]|uniref:F-box domain-containing protein n=1 Tax=Lolium multiflorum TaxID=4521 RepID=A0AAD8T244_LOLMU|nr:hypothetical protein QYE76_056426 [Lolium multiflorum]